MLLQQLSYLSHDLIDQRATTKLQYEKISKILENYRDPSEAVIEIPNKRSTKSMTHTNMESVKIV